MHEAIANSSKLLAAKEEEIKKLHEKKLMDFEEKSKLIREEKLSEGRTAVRQIKAKAEKNIEKAVELVMKEIEERV